MIVVGLTGGIATGKSAVSQLLKANHIPVIDADVLARQVVEPGTPALSKIVAYFGHSILLPNGTLDRKQLGNIVFNDEVKRRKLNAIVHPAVSRAMAWGILMHWFRGEKCCVTDVPLLIEGGLWKWVGKVVVVYCSAEIQLQRLMKRDNSSREDALARLRSQMPITKKVEYADQVIENSGSLHDLEMQVDSFVQRLERESGWTWRVSWLFPPFGLLSAIWVLAWRGIRRFRASARRRAVDQL
jgi:dephospho-CoA kinase